MAQKILRSFKALGLDRETFIDFHIKFLEPQNFDDALGLMQIFFLRDEVMCKSLEIIKDPNEVEVWLKFWRNVIETEKISIGCFEVKGESEKLIGLNVLSVKNKNDEAKEPEKFNIFVETIGIMDKSFNVFEHHKVEQFLYAYGLAVDSSYRGRGIAMEILKARVQVLKFLNLKVTSTIFTSAASQKAAQKANFEENFKKTYEEIQKIDERIFFPGLENECMKVMSLRIQ